MQALSDNLRENLSEPHMINPLDDYFQTRFERCCFLRTVSFCSTVDVTQSSFASLGESGVNVA